MLTVKNQTLRAIMRLAIPFVLIPATAILGVTVFDSKKHIFISLFIAILSVFLFIAGFEKKQTGSRRMVIVAVMTALSVVGRFIPFFKPITAITVITGAYLGGEAGFLVGALSALISNFYFGQGPWTAFQMLSWGLVGLFAGFLGKALRKHKLLLVMYGVLTGITYSLTMDVWSVIWYNGAFNAKLFTAAIVTALPFTVIYSLSNFIFLMLMAKPFGDKLERIKVKYGV